MKRVLVLMVALLFVSVGLMGQESYGSKGQVFNQATVMYSSSTFIATTTTATTAKIPFYPASAIRVFARTTDSLTAQIRYRLTNSTIGYTTGYFVLDTVVTLFALDGASTDTVLVLGHKYTKTADNCDTLRLAQARLAGFDQIQFEIDYLTGTSTGSGGTGRMFRLYYYFVKP
jgi:hypothetical protein